MPVRKRRLENVPGERNRAALVAKDFSRPDYPARRPKMHDMVDAHAGESETAHMLVARPDPWCTWIAWQPESGADQERQDLPKSVYTGIWWYGKVSRALCRQPSAGDQGAS